MTVQITTTNQNADTQRQKSFPSSPFRLFEDFFNDWAMRSLRSDERRDAWTPSVDVMERGGNLVLRVEVPGVAENDIEAKIEGSTLTIKGNKKQADPKAGTLLQSEISYGAFSRTFALPETVDTEKISAKFRNGILTITLPEKAECQPRSIKINLQ